jgi:hypothetical protein
LYVYLSFVAKDVVYTERRTVSCVARGSSFQWNIDGSIDGRGGAGSCCRTSTTVQSQPSSQLAFPAMSTPPLHTRNAVELDFEAFPRCPLKVEFALWRDNGRKPPQLLGHCSHDVTTTLLNRRALHVVPTFPLCDGKGQPVPTTLTVVLDVKYAPETIAAGLVSARPLRK